MKNTGVQRTCVANWKIVEWWLQVTFISETSYRKLCQSPMKASTQIPRVVNALWTWLQRKALITWHLRHTPIIYLKLSRYFNEKRTMALDRFKLLWTRAIRSRLLNCLFFLSFVWKTLLDGRPKPHDCKIHRFW